MLSFRRICGPIAKMVWFNEFDIINSIKSLIKTSGFKATSETTDLTKSWFGFRPNDESKDRSNTLWNWTSSGFIRRTNLGMYWIKLLTSTPKCGITGVFVTKSSKSDGDIKWHM